MHPATPVAATADANERVGLIEQPVIGRPTKWQAVIAKPIATGTNVWLDLEESAAAQTTSNKKPVKITSTKKPKINIEIN